MIPKSCVAVLVALAVLLPMVAVVLAAVSPLLRAMEDATGANLVNGFSRGVAVLWAVDLVVLLVTLAVESLERRGSSDE